MAYGFFAGKMASQQLDSALTNVLAQNGSGTNIAIKDGSLVVLGALAPDTTYSAAGVEYDTYIATAPAAVTDEVVVVDYAGISEGSILGNIYKEGVKLFDLEVPAGRIARARRLHLHDKFWLGADNFVSAPVVGQYAVATASSFLHTPSATLVAGQYNIKVLLSKDLTTGMTAHGLQYLCEVVAL